MELTTAGRLVLWLGVCLVAAGTLLSNTIILASAAILLLFLLTRGASFHRALDSARDSIRIQSHPSTIETTIGRPFKVETVVTNASRSEFSITRFKHNLPPQVGEEPNAISSIPLRINGEQQIETLLNIRTAGRYEINASTTTLEQRSHLFRQTVDLPEKIIITARPFVSQSVEPIETGALQDLIADHQRRGTGTDLAGIRPYNVHDDFHRIDWKATARAGKLMTKESFLEREPTVILMVDISNSMKTRSAEHSVLEVFLNEAGNFLAAIRISTPLGLILFDRHEVVASVQARQGVDNRERILRTLLEKSENTPLSASPERGTFRPYADLARMEKSLAKQSEFAGKAKSNQNRLYRFASFFLPFYERAESNYFKRAREKGAFKAFEIVRGFREPALVIVISDGESDLDGLVEGIESARVHDHRVLLVTFTSAPSTERVEPFPLLEDGGVRVLRCSPEELPMSISAAILGLSHTRAITIDAAR